MALSDISSAAGSYTSSKQVLQPSGTHNMYHTPFPYTIPPRFMQAENRHLAGPSSKPWGPPPPYANPGFVGPMGQAGYAHPRSNDRPIPVMAKPPLRVHDSTTGVARPYEPTPFKPHGIEALPTKAIVPIVCKNFLRGFCDHQRYCPRIHPVDLLYYREMLREEGAEHPAFYREFRPPPPDGTTPLMSDATIPQSISAIPAVTGTAPPQHDVHTQEQAKIQVPCDSIPSGENVSSGSQSQARRYPTHDRVPSSSHAQPAQDSPPPRLVSSEVIQEGKIQSKQSVAKSSRRNSHEEEPKRQTERRPATAVNDGKSIALSTSSLENGSSHDNAATGKVESGKVLEGTTRRKDEGAPKPKSHGDKHHDKPSGATQKSPPNRKGTEGRTPAAKSGKADVLEGDAKFQDTTPATSNVSLSTPASMWIQDVPAKVEGISRQDSYEDHAIRPNPRRVTLSDQTSLAPTSTLRSSSPRREDADSEWRMRITGVCDKWMQGMCWRGKSCPHSHLEMAPSKSATDGGLVSLVERHAPPPKTEICWQWLRDECRRGYACSFTHRDLEYDHTLPRRGLFPIPIRKPPEVISRTLHKHIKVKISDGFEVTQVVTGFETSWVYLGSIPKNTSQGSISRLVKAHGDLHDLRMPEKINSPFIVVRARFTSAAEASKACATLNGLEALGSTITARLSLDNSNSKALLNDTTVRVTWEAPCKTAYGGYQTQEKANLAIEKCRTTPFADRSLRAVRHTGLPAVGMFNVRFEGVPPETDIQEMKEFCGADDIMWGKVNYTSLQESLSGITRMVKNSGNDILQFEIVPPPYKAGQIIGWAQLPTAAEARELCERIHNRKPTCVGRTRIMARHLQSLEYTLNNDLFAEIKNDLEDLKATAWRGHMTVNLYLRPTSVSIRLSGEDTKQLSELKAELDIILSGEVIRDQGKVAWDPFFSHPGRSFEFVTGLRRAYPAVKIDIERTRRNIRLFGPSSDRRLVRTRILEQIQRLRKQSVFTMVVDGRVIGMLLSDEFPGLAQRLGEDNVFLDIWDRTLKVRGDMNAKNQAMDALSRIRRKLRTDQTRATLDCPVCFDEVTVPVTLCCGHSWCKTCIIRYMTSAIDQRYFPLTCLGDEAKCQEKIPLSCAEQLLPKADYETLVETSFSAYVQRNPTEFAYCPTPDCQQVYRPMARVQVTQNKPSDPSNKSSTSNSTSHPSSSSSSNTVSVGTILQCPSCLVRICASCQTEAHDGFTCVRPDEGDALFEEWMKNNDVKLCPGCKMPIEKMMGCHHVTCSVCATHLCWICLMPFVNGSGVYSHMLAMHGSFV